MKELILCFVVKYFNRGYAPILLSDELIKLRWSNVNKKRYVDKGYVFTSNGDEFYAKEQDVLECSSGVKIPIKCDYCGEIYYPTVRNYKKRAERGEKDCCTNCKGLKIRETVEDKYGVKNVALIESVSEKIKNTCLKKYGTQSPLENSDVFAKTKESFNAHYNTSNGIADLRSVEELSRKIEDTNIERYGGVSPFCSESVRIKIRKKFFENGTCATSKKQLGLAEMLKEIYGDCVVNYPCDLVSLDCVVSIDGELFDFEYDGWYWHKDRKEQDKRRDFFVEKSGYKVIRFLAYADRLPTQEEIVGAVDYLTTTKSSFIKIELT